MTMTLDVPKDLETRIRDRAAEQGVQPDALMVRLLAESQALMPTPPGSLSARESELLGRVNLGFAEAFWSRYHHLTERLESEQLSPAEHAEFMSKVAEVEEANARRVAAVVELAALRGTSFATLWDQLGLGHKARHE
jgi:hypothetical protein